MSTNGLHISRLHMNSCSQCRPLLGEHFDMYTYYDAVVQWEQTHVCVHTRTGAHTPTHIKRESLNMVINTRHMAHLDGRWSFGLKYFTSPPAPLQPSPPVDELCIHPHNLKLIQLILLRFFFLSKYVFIWVLQNHYPSEHYNYAHDGWIRPPNPYDHIHYTQVPKECETIHISTSTIQTRQHQN